VPSACADLGTLLHAMVRGKSVPMRVSALPFLPHRYVRGSSI
jgi:aminomethyltransferase